MLEVMKVTTIRDERERQGLTQTELSIKAMISPTMISRVENGKPVSKVTLRRICQALNVSPDEITGVELTRRTPRNR